MMVDSILLFRLSNSFQMQIIRASPPTYEYMARQQQLRVILLLLLFPLYADRSWHLHSTKVLCTTIFFGRNLFTVATTIQSG